MPPYSNVEWERCKKAAKFYRVDFAWDRPLADPRRRGFASTLLAEGRAARRGQVNARIASHVEG